MGGLTEQQAEDQNTEQTELAGQGIGGLNGHEADSASANAKQTEGMKKGQELANLNREQQADN